MALRQDWIIVIVNKERLDKPAWLQMALDTLNEKGIEAVKVGILARKLGITRGSFYWHFKNRRQFLNEVADFWRDTYAVAGLIYATELKGSARDRYWELNKYLLSELPHRYDTAIRIWALHDTYADKVVKAVDKMRLAHASETFREMGFGNKEAATRAELFYFSLIGHLVARPRETVRQRNNQAKHRFDIMTTK